MIRFDLVCAQDHIFEGWFRDGAAYDTQAASGTLTCPVCGDSAVRKAVMAPAISRGRPDSAPADPRRERLAQMMSMARQVQDYVEKNFDNVGERFPEEARRMHIGETPHRDIYGKATQEEASALREEGVPIRQLPMLPKLDG
jgi:hypothetical protein